MNAEALIAKLRALDVSVRAEGERLHCDAPPQVLTDELLAELAAHKAELMDWLGHTVGSARSKSPPILPVARDREMSLSFAQLIFPRES